MSYGEVTMNRAGIDRLVTQLEFYRDQLDEETEE
jgi:hypothetical protein